MIGSSLSSTSIMNGAAKWLGCVQSFGRFAGRTSGSCKATSIVDKISGVHAVPSRCFNHRSFLSGERPFHMSKVHPMVSISNRNQHQIGPGWPMCMQEQVKGEGCQWFSTGIEGKTQKEVPVNRQSGAEEGISDVAKQGSKVDRQVTVFNFDLEPVGTYKLDGQVFDVPVRRDVLHNVVVWQRAKKRQGTSKVKTRGERRGGGRKPFPQKKTGRARAGSIR